ncbi:uncharacterized protein [Nyctibius grandis]|uniref:uncharacterized protein n=1 Tax=Nyctibius grandis TaxID=48427 RepID=UPI0035BC8F22
MWVLLLPLGLGRALLPPGLPAPAPRRGPPEGRGGPSAGCGLCHSPHGGRAQANGTRGDSVTLGCPAAGAPLGRLLAEQWHFWGDPAGAGVTVCSRSRGRPRCDAAYGDRVVLAAGGDTPGVLVLRRLRDEDAGTYTCLLLGEGDCACGEVTLRLGGERRRGDPHPGVGAAGMVGAPHPGVGAVGTGEPLTPASGMEEPLTLALGLWGWWVVPPAAPPAPGPPPRGAFGLFLLLLLLLLLLTLAGGL